LPAEALARVVDRRREPGRPRLLRDLGCDWAPRPADRQRRRSRGGKRHDAARSALLLRRRGALGRYRGCAEVGYRSSPTSS